jgi:hypothetical protein
MSEQPTVSSGEEAPPPHWSSLSSKRAEVAHDWVDKQIHQLAEVIIKHGTTNLTGDGEVSINFGHLFHLYQDISSSLVGILRRAKQRKLITYKGEMLYQSTHSGVEITLVSKEK